MTGKELMEFILNNDLQDSDILVHSTYGVHDLDESDFELKKG